MITSGVRPDGVLLTAASLSVLGGDDGYTLFGPHRCGSAPGCCANRADVFYFVCLAVLVAGLADSVRSFSTAVSAACCARRSKNPTRVEALGFSPLSVSSGRLCPGGRAICGLAGALLANATLNSSRPPRLSWGRSGGAVVHGDPGRRGTSLSGAILGGALPSSLLEEWSCPSSVEYWRLVFGPLLVTVGAVPAARRPGHELVSYHQGHWRTHEGARSRSL